MSIQPSNARDWSVDSDVIPFAEIDSNLIHIHNVRDFNYRAVDDFDIKYMDKTYDLNNLDSLYFMVEPFGDFQGPAHTLLSFGFGDEYLAVSVEIRKEKGEKYSAVKGLFRQYELMYVFGTETDLIKLRSNYRKDDVYLYPIKASEERMRNLFLRVVEDANDLYQNPTFYNTITNTCTTNIVKHINSMEPGKIPFSYKILLPGYSDELAYDLGLIDTELDFETAKIYYQINELSEKYADSEDYSSKIRKEII